MRDSVTLAESIGIWLHYKELDILVYLIWVGRNWFDDKALQDTLRSPERVDKICVLEIHGMKCTFL